MLRELLAKKIRKLDDEYIKLIFKLYYKAAYNAAYFYCGDRNIAEEAAQEAILKAIKNIYQLREPDKIEPWIKKIAVNNTIKLLSKHEKIVNLENSLPISDSDNSPEYIIESQETINTMSVWPLSPLILL